MQVIKVQECLSKIKYCINLDKEKEAKKASNPLTDTLDHCIRVKVYIIKSNKDHFNTSSGNTNPGQAWKMCFLAMTISYFSFYLLHMIEGHNYDHGQFELHQNCSSVLDEVLMYKVLMHEGQTTPFTPLVCLL